MDEEVEEPREVAMEESVSRIVESKLKTDVSSTYARSEVENLFASQLNISGREIVAWTVNVNPNTAMQHVCDAVQPARFHQ